MRKLTLVPVLVLVAALGLVTSPAHADGGTYPSNAPVLSSGQTVSGGATTTQSCGNGDAGKAGVQYYRIPLAFGDTLVADFTNVTGYGTYLGVLAPDVTDYTVSNAQTLASASTPSSQKAELKYVAPAAGSYLLVITCRSSGTSWAYSLAVNVLHSTTVSASGPTGVKVGHKVKVTGQASVAGTVTLQLKSGGWKDVAKAATKADGTFKLKYKPAATGRLKLRVVFAGPPGYLGSLSSKIKVQVHR